MPSEASGFDQHAGAADRAADAAALDALRAALAAMPPVAAMQLAVVGYDGVRLRTSAPLAPNVNDKGCAFGGSLNSLMTITAWGLCFLRLHASGVRADTFVQDSSIRYLAPLYADLEAEAWMAADSDAAAFASQLRLRGRARAQLAARVLLPDGADAATFHGRFVALRSG